MIMTNMVVIAYRTNGGFLYDPLKSIGSGAKKGVISWLTQSLINLISINKAYETREFLAILFLNLIKSSLWLR